MGLFHLLYFSVLPVCGRRMEDMWTQLWTDLLKTHDLSCSWLQTTENVMILLWSEQPNTEGWSTNIRELFIQQLNHYWFFYRADYVCVISKTVNQNNFPCTSGGKLILVFINRDFEVIMADRLTQLQDTINQVTLTINILFKVYVIILMVPLCFPSASWIFL